MINQFDIYLIKYIKYRNQIQIQIQAFSNTWNSNTNTQIQIRIWPHPCQQVILNHSHQRHIHSQKIIVKCKYKGWKRFWSWSAVKGLTLKPPNYSIRIFTHLKLCLADAINNFKWLKIIQIWQNEGQLFSNLAGWCHILSLACLKVGT